MFKGYIMVLKYLCIISIAAIVLISFFSNNSLFGNELNRETRIPYKLKGSQIGDFVPKEHYKLIRFDMNSIGVDLDEIKLKDIINYFGQADIYSGPHVESNICYLTKFAEKIEFTSTPLGFGYTVVSDIKLTDELATKCTKLSDIPQPVVSGAGLRTGLTKEETINLLGKPSRCLKDYCIYSYWIQQRAGEEFYVNKNITKIKENEVWADVMTLVRIIFHNGYVSSFSVFTEKSY